MRTLHRKIVVVVALLAGASLARGDGRRAAPQRGDIVIAGAGAAGSVLAVRLAKQLHDSGRPGKIVLIEAGGDKGNRLLAVHAHSADPDSSFSKGLNLAYPVRYLSDKDQNTRRFNYNRQKGGDLHTRGKGNGGSSNHHAGFNLFPPQSDWAEIARVTGDSSWSPQAMARYEAIVREMIPTESTGIGDSGPLGDEHPVAAVDPNDDVVRRQVPEGLLKVPVNTRGVLRYGPRELLSDAMKKYPGRIEVLSNTIVDRAILDRSGKVVGVKILSGGTLGSDSEHPGRRGTEHTIMVDKAFVDSTGSFEAPGMMYRAGLGPKDKVAALGIEPRVDLPGVGEGLGSRIEVPVIAKMNPLKLGRMLLQAGSRNGGLFLWGRKSRPELAEIDGVQIGLFGRFTGYNWGYSKKLKAPAMTQLDLQTTTHSHGFVRPQSADPRVRPDIQFNMFDPAHDPQGLDLAAAIKGTRQMIARAKKMGAKQLWDLETEKWVPLAKYEQMSDAQLGTVMKRIGWDHHPSGTAAMGSPTDPMTVTQSNFVARGTDNYYNVSLAIFKKPLGFFPVYGLYAASIKAADGLFERYYQQP
jgi:choline dehydrogenase